MKLGEARQEANELTGLLSSVNRQLLLAGVAVVWLFSGGSRLDAEQVNVPDDLEWALFVLVAGLGADFLQYAGQALGTRFVYRAINERYRKAKAADPSLAAPDVSFPHWIAVWAEAFFLAKALAVLIGYVLLMLSAGDRVF